MTFKNAFERASELISYMAANERGWFGYSLMDFAEKYGIPVEIVRRDLAVLMKHPIFSVYITIGEDDEDYSEEKMLDGSYDNLVIGFDFISMVDEDDVLLVPLSKIENPVVKRWLGGKNALFMVKQNGNEITESVRNNISKIYEAIDKNSVIEYEYTNSKGELDRWCRCRPAEVRINLQRPGDAKLIASNGAIFSIRGMNNIKLLKKSDHVDVDKGINNDWDVIWNLPSPKGSREGQTYHVKLEVKNSTRNIMEKFKSDISRRKFKKLTQKEDGIFIYEDEVSGFNDFKKWIMAYGSNIKVLEPEWLAEEIRDEFRKMKKQYETGEFE